MKREPSTQEAQDEDQAEVESTDRAIRHGAGEEPGVVSDPARYAPERTQDEELP